VTHGIDTSFLVAAEVTGHADHVAARTLAVSLRNQGDRFAVAPQALAEFAHIVTCRHVQKCEHRLSDLAKVASPRTAPVRPPPTAEPDCRRRLTTDFTDHTDNHGVGAAIWRATSTSISPR